jgi:hypothetical protein
VGGAALMLGYTWEWVWGEPSPVSRELREFNRAEQRERLRTLVARAGRVVHRVRDSAVPR